MHMANPRRNSIAERPFLPPLQTLRVTGASAFLSLKHLLKKPHAFPFLLSIFLFLAWLSLRLQYQYSSSSPANSNRQSIIAAAAAADDDEKANLLRFKSALSPSPILKDNRGWLLDPISLALRSSIRDIGGAMSCASIHVGEIQPGAMRGNHRHHTANETFVIWGAKTLFRLENSQIVDKGYAQVIVGADEVAVAASPSGTAHALVNVDPIRSTFFLGCQDSTVKYNSSTTDYSVWKDL